MASDPGRDHALHGISDLLRRAIDDVLAARQGGGARSSKGERDRHEIKVGETTPDRDDEAQAKGTDRLH